MSSTGVEATICAIVRARVPGAFFMNSSKICKQLTHGLSRFWLFREQNYRTCFDPPYPVLTIRNLKPFVPATNHTHFRAIRGTKRCLRLIQWAEMNDRFPCHNNGDLLARVGPGKKQPASRNEK